MIESAAMRLVESPLVKRMLAFANRLPIPFHRVPVTVDGHRMVARTLDRFLALWFWKFGVFGRAERGLAGRLCREGMAVLDVGANVGFHTLLFARAVGPEGTVWAFEPDPDNFATLERNIVRNGYGNIKAVRAAVGAATGKASLYRSAFHCDHRVYRTQNGPQGLPIEMVSIDDFLPPDQRVDFVKMDVQGAEGMVLRGMRRILSANPGITLIMEFWPEGLRATGCSPETVLSDLGEAGLTLYRIDERSDRLERLADAGSFLASLSGSSYANLLAASDARLPEREIPGP